MLFRSRIAGGIERSGVLAGCWQLWLRFGRGVRVVEVAPRASSRYEVEHDDCESAPRKRSLGTVSLVGTTSKEVSERDFAAFGPRRPLVA